MNAAHCSRRVEVESKFPDDFAEVEPTCSCPVLFLPKPCFMPAPATGNKCGNFWFRSVKQVKRINDRIRGFVMTRKLSTFAIMACLASSLAFAGDKNKPASPADSAKAETSKTTASDKVPQEGSNPCASAKGDKKNKHNAKPAPTDQDREFDKVLRGIYG
jgi:hypothetical protein